MTSKFKVGDTVIGIKQGSGLGIDDLNIKVKITEIGHYFKGYDGIKVYPPIGNTKSGGFNGFIGMNSFKIVSQNLIAIW